jgi:hypothetical protein
MYLNSSTERVIRSILKDAPGINHLVGAFMSAGVRIGKGQTDSARARQVVHNLKSAFQPTTVVLIPVSKWNQSLMVDTCSALALLLRCWPDRFTKELGALAATVQWAIVRPLAPPTISAFLALVEPAWGKPQKPLPVTDRYDTPPAQDGKTELADASLELKLAQAVQHSADLEQRVADLEGTLQSRSEAFRTYTDGQNEWRKDVEAKLQKLQPLIEDSQPEQPVGMVRVT